MLWEYKGKPIPLEIYHGVPVGWRAAEIVAEHRRLGGSFVLEGPEAWEPGAPSWMPDRFEWLQYRQTLHRVGDGVRANDPACAELAIRYIELRYIGSYSGYIRGRLARSLKHAALAEGQRARLHAHFGALYFRKEWSAESAEYFKLWRHVLRDEEFEWFLVRLGKQPDGAKRVEWLKGKLL